MTRITGITTGCGTEIETGIGTQMVTGCGTSHGAGKTGTAGCGMETRIEMVACSTALTGIEIGRIIISMTGQ
jgi:hypothetical protein